MKTKRCSCKADTVGLIFWSKLHQKHVSCELHADQPVLPVITIHIGELDPAQRLALARGEL